jgi:D-alanyl-D-alanine carboxypeptidase/D-alanyl-D-alanine-endopeptidase (penicillin-binding protein 4)
MDSGSQCEIAWRWETPDSMLFVSGKMAEGRIEKLRIPVENPSSYFLRSLKSIFTKEGIETTGEVRILDLRQEDLSKTKFKTIFSHYSPPLSEIVRIANTESVNLYAEQLLRLIGFKLYLKGSPEAGIDGIESLFAEAGINLNEVHLVDGCGLSRHNWVSAQAFVSLLEYCRYCDFYEVWFNSLPAYGEGTLQYRSLSEIPAEICAKTGSMEGVRALSGYAFVKDKEYAFSFICNNYQCPSTKIEDTIDKVISYILMKQ